MAASTGFDETFGVEQANRLLDGGAADPEQRR